jgi:hypothetical protein
MRTETLPKEDQTNLRPQASARWTAKTAGLLVLPRKEKRNET